MRTLTKNAIAAVALAGASFAFAGGANAAASFFVGLNGVQIGYSEGYYYDRFHHRHTYYYPRDWRNYGYPLAYYRDHDRWWRDRDWDDRYSRWHRDHDRGRERYGYNDRR